MRTTRLWFRSPRRTTAPQFPFMTSECGITALDLWSKVLLPLMNVRMPASGDMYLNFHPWTNWGVSADEAGDPEIEDEIFAIRALPGKQLGRLNDAVMVLIELAEEKHGRLDKGQSKQAVAIRDFKELAERIRIRKEALQGKRTLTGGADSTFVRLTEACRTLDRLLGEAENTTRKKKRKKRKKK